MDTKGYPEYLYSTKPNINSTIKTWTFSGFNLENTRVIYISNYNEVISFPLGFKIAGQQSMNQTTVYFLDKDNLIDFMIERLRRRIDQLEKMKENA